MNETPTRSWVRGLLPGVQEHIIDRVTSEFEHEQARHRTLRQELEQQLEDARNWNQRVRVCEHHVHDVVGTDGRCLVCEAKIADDERRTAERVSDELQQELDDAYAELHKQWPALTAVYNRAVHDRARAWYERVYGKDES